MTEKKMCPHCGGTLFMAAITRGCIVEVSTSDEKDKEDVFNVSKETKDKYTIELVKCIRCKHEVSKDELIVGVQCKECGRPTAPSDLNKDGICPVCEAKKNRAELANASTDDLIRMLLEAEKRGNSVSEKISKKIEKAEEVTSAQTNNVNDTDDSTEKEVKDESQDAEKEPTTKKRQKAPRGRKKNTNEEETVESNEDSDTAEEQPSEDNKADDTKEAVDDIANSQEAPFPDFPEMNAPVDTPVDTQETISEDTTVVENTSEESVNEPEAFQMFDENEEPF